MISAVGGIPPKLFVAGSGAMPELVAQYNADGNPVCQKS